MHEKKPIVRKLTSTVNSCGIATFSVRREGLRFFDSLKCMNTIFQEFQMTATVLSRLRLHKLFIFFVRREDLLFFDSLKCMNTIFRGFQMTATVLQHQRLH